MVHAQPPEGKTVVVTVGTTRFDGLIDVVDGVEFQSRLQSLGYTNIVYQIGRGRRIPAISILNLFVYDYLDNFCEFIEQAELIVSHSGAGTLLDVSEYRKPVIFVVNEDTSESHQKELTKVLGPNYFASLETLLDKLDDPIIAPKDVFTKLLSGDKLRGLISNLFDD
ncbi:glycosyltransferase family 28 C-terminal domain containing protein [Theileria equi strain WA]|uniref:UDP-N-acetylglucosamine transferase subunit ALG13 n=1 Tax=Theileria equi strain WA TaxID=1537102 RepID=L0AUZ9_THEEQ|nr:glycosyltransferase family 28 C-terminal domain containing protein [Theileria equi strain WA]AFZ79422.1 glycosyltransferase family 28 C-terminal domain containing protein [Theileria equi strain WA]|eukprot:XP_004829088.1 glycosyltransferase family 28 C-terminal domain containing protein [Theileria equi strain WA]